MVPHVPSAATIGWFARDALMLRRIGEVLPAEQQGVSSPVRVLIAEDWLDIVRFMGRGCWSTGFHYRVFRGHAAAALVPPAGGKYFSSLL